MRHHDETDDLRLVALGALKRYRVAKGEPDIRGWDVVTSDHRKVGQVHELIVDRETMKVRYLDVAIAGKFLGIKDNSHVLIPISGAHLDDDDNRVYLSDVSVGALASIPPYDHRALTRYFETTLTGFFQRDGGHTPGRDFYEDEAFDDRQFWAARRSGREAAPYVTPEEEVRLREEEEERERPR